MSKTVVITGGSRGIGKAALQLFLENGDFIIATSTSGQLDLSAQDVIAVRLDLSKPGSISQASQQIREICQQRNATIDILINNAGIVHDFDEMEVYIPGLRQTLEVNLIGTIDFTEALLSVMAKGGHILNISSLSGSLTENVGPLMPSYKISKVALNMYTRTLADRLRDRNITVSSVDPGWVQTDMGGEEAPVRVEDAARHVFELANAKIESGLFWREGKKRSW
jgi:NAD(P)-dependent dehydrogenase (short-subunit alcohol dehydrogenase family)